MNTSTQLRTFTELPWLKIFSQTIDQPQSLPAALAEHGLTLDQLFLFSKKSEDASEPYGRKLLFNNDEIEVMLACWSEKAAASPHNHGHSQGLIWFARGYFSEQHFRFQDRELKKTELRQYPEGHVVRVDGNDIHSCSPNETGLSLHIYSPPIHQMKVWDAKHRKTLIVADHCGAWVPKNKELILSETAW